ncbi:MAG: hypothetical protein ABFS39_15745 [Pseudomonadota bacterium]
MKPSNEIPTNERMRAFVTGIILFALCLFFPFTQIRAEDRPTIQVNFDFEGDLFQRLSEENRTAIESSVEDLVCELGEKRWGFLDWSNDLPPSTDVAEWNIKFKVEIRQFTNDSGGTSPGTIGTLEHFGKLESEESKFDQIEEHEIIYPLGRLIPFNDPPALRGDLSAQLEKQLDRLFESLQVEIYVRNIPIVERVIADAEIERLVVPLKISDLRTDVDSILRVLFIEPNDDPGRLDLETSGAVSMEGQNKGYVVGWVKELRHSSVAMPDPSWGYEQLLPVIDGWREVKVYMFSYSPSLAGSWATENGVSTDPDQGGETP